MPEDRKRRKSPHAKTVDNKYSRRNGDRHREDRHSNEDIRRSSSSTKLIASPLGQLKQEEDVKPYVKTELPTTIIHKPKEVILEELKNKEIMHQAKMAIAEKIKEQKLLMNLVTPSSASSTASINSSSATLRNASVLKREEASAFIDYQMEKVNRLKELKTRIPKNVPSLKTPMVVLDSLAAGIKSTTQLSHLHQRGIKAETSIERKPPTMAISTTPAAGPPSESTPIIEHLDPRIAVRSAQKPARRAAFAFKAKGEYEKLANVQRTKAKLEKLQSEIAKAAKQTGISSAVKLAIVTPSGSESADVYIPTVEWWDEVVLGSGKGYGDIPSVDENPQLRYADSISNLVEHPIQLKPPDEPMQPQYLKACLTKKERKKLRRQNRREVQKEFMEKVRLGLEKPPEPKLKISNLMRVLGSDAVQDPTKMEVHVRKQIAERVQKHAQDNASRKLTREQRAAKAIRKVTEDTSTAVHVAIYKIKSLANAKHKFKVHLNAVQLHMTGILLLLEDINIVVVEGGPKQQKFYKNLLLNRIKWAEDTALLKKAKESAASTTENSGVNNGRERSGQQDQQQPPQRNECTLIWEGIVQKRAFGEPRFHQPTNIKHAREILDKHGVAHYWDLCYSTSVLLSSED